MGKPKRRPHTTTPTNELDITCGPDGLPVEDDWVMVKKQKVTILIPPLPVTSECTMHEPSSSQQEVMPVNAAKDQSGSLIETYPFMNSASEKEMPVSLIAGNAKAIPSEGIKSPPQPVKGRPEKEEQNLRMRSKALTSKRKTTEFDRNSKVIKRPLSFVDGGVLLQRKMRASNLERKLEKAGGLSSWLASLGLEQFIRIFKGRKVNKFQLVNLTMSKLKEMGADAVGPRRKLMHAINCICQPCCFQQSRVSYHRLRNF